jgi:hypothetical protein
MITAPSSSVSMIADTASAFFAGMAPIFALVFGVFLALLVIQRIIEILAHTYYGD